MSHSKRRQKKVISLSCVCMFNQSCMCKVWDRTQNYISVYPPHTRQAFPLHKTQGPFRPLLSISMCISCHRRGVRSYGKLPSMQLQGMTYPGEIQLKGYLRYQILLKDNRTFRTLLDDPSLAETLPVVKSQRETSVKQCIGQEYLISNVFQIPSQYNLQSDFIPYSTK